LEKECVESTSTAEKLCEDLVEHWFNTYYGAVKQDGQGVIAVAAAAMQRKVLALVALRNLRASCVHASFPLTMKSLVDSAARAVVGVLQADSLRC
jgi:hypothetical protein